ncbi:FemAB family XrtA/PEP-CTERM system-associated protein [Sphingosinicella sp.]|uniref:FemAB family XrtA/PEP-CTERM system-associated protein n=1 Tax=Sphingosinicella sp. TaxID=1917971 RepID=UPI0035B08E04
MNAESPIAPTVVEIDIDDAGAAAAFDAAVLKHPGATPFHRTAWGRAIRDALGHTPHYLMAGDAVLPLIALRSGLFGSALISNAFAVRGGPLAADPRALAALDKAAWAIAEAGGIGVLEYRGTEALHPDWAVKAETYANFVRPLEADSEANLKAIPRKQRAEVRRSLTMDLSVRVASDEKALRDHFAVYSESVRNLGTPVFPARLFAEIVRHFGEDADILTVYHQDVPVASVLSVYDAETVYPYYGGGTAAARALRANDHMYWMLMEHAVARGRRAFDFGRSKYDTGAFAFKKNWGFEPQPLVYEYRLAEGRTMPDVNPNNPKYKLMTEVWSRLPLWLANRMGPLVSRSLG